MKQTILFILMILSFSAFCQIDYRQSSEKAYVYQLTDEQALKLVEIDFDGYLKDFQAFKYFGEPIDSISIGNRFVIPDYSLGHYVIVRVVGEEVQYKFISEYAIGIVPVYDKRKMRFHLIDSLGNFIEADKVTLDGKTVKYKSDKQYYEHKRFRDARLLIIKKGEKLAFYEIERDDDENWFVRQWEKVIDWNIWTSPWYALGNFWRRFSYPFRTLRNFGNFPTYGYITTNKPKYLPQDTVKIKAYLTNKNGRPLNRELTLKITNYGNFKFEKTIKPTTKGSYIFDFPLGDSLQLDKQYQVEFWKGKKRLMQTYFNYEDYQLDETTYDFRAEKERFKRYEPIVFYASGKNANGQNILDGEVEILASSANVSAYHAKKVLIPDTLFYYKGALEVNDLTTNEMRFVIPKETIPMADFNVNIRAIFTNANGELTTKNLNTYIISDSTFLDVRMEADTLVVDYLVNGKSTKAIGTLNLELAETDFYIEKTIQLPYKEKINPVFEKVEVRVENEYKELNFQYRNSELKKPSFSLIQTADSVFVFGYNPSGLVVNYDIYRINRKVEKGNSNEKLIVWKDKIRSKKSYRIDYEYIINSKNETQTQYFDYAKNQLTIDIEQPNQIQPGETVDVKIKVKSSKNRAAKNVNLVAGAVNTQFKNTDNWKYNVPFLGKRSKRKKVENNYYYNGRINEYNFYAYDVFDWKDTITQKNRSDFELDKHLYYQLLFADNGYFGKSINVKSDTFNAQFAPFVIRNNRFEPTYLIYANRRLLYYHDAVSPYSFQGRAGYNTILVRGIDFEIQIDSVFLKAGEKLVFSIDLDNLPKNAKRTEKPKEWTNSEKALLRKSIFTYRNKISPHQIYVWQSGIVYPHYINKNITNFGPFEPNQNINLIKKNAFQTKFKFEPEFIYEVEKNRERLYYTDAFPKNESVRLMGQNARMALQDTLFTNRQIPIFTPKRYKPLIQQQIEKAFKNINYSTNNKSNYKAIIDNTNEAIDTTHFAFIFINQKNNKKYFYKGNSNTFGGLVRGNYKMYAYTIWGNYFEHDVEIKKDTLTYEFLDFLTYQSDEKLLNLLTIMNLKEIKIENRKQIGNNGQPIKNTNLKLSNDTYLISGIIKDENGEVLIGVNVTVSDGDKVYGTVSNLDGYYELIVPNRLRSPKIVVNYLGYSTLEIRANKTNNNIVLSQNDEVLEEVVVVGYGMSKKLKESSMSIQKITAEEVQRMPSRDISAIAGQVAGVSSDKKQSLQLLPIASSNFEAPLSNLFSNDSLNINQLAENSKIRSRFQDYAFWQPNLITDKKGEATFRVTYPDDITAYKTFVLGMDKRQRFGIATKTVKSQKTALAQLAVPRFLVQGDEVNVIGKSLNYSNDSLRIKSTFLLENDVLKTNDFWLNSAEIETANFKANTDKDTLQLTYKMEHEKFFDGEKRPIPIYKKGVKETVGSFNILTGDTTITLHFDKDKGNVKLYAQTDILEVLLKDVDYLINYQYGCNEQTASRLMALLMNDKIRKLTEVDYENSKADLKNQQHIKKMVKRLEEAQNGDGSWGWWRGNTKNYWMTNYVLKALHAADSSGYKTASYETGLRFITNSLSEMKGKDLLNAIELLSDLQQNMDYEKYVVALDTQIIKRDIYNQLILTKVKQQQGLPYNLNLLDSLEKRTLFGNVFYDIDRSKMNWAYRFGYRYWYSNHYNLTTLAYQIIKNESGNNKNKLAAIRGYFLEKRTNYGWRNTFTTAQILATILPDIANVSNREKPQLVIKGNTRETVTEFPYETTFYANDDLEIQKTGTSTVYFTAYQQFWNEKPTPKFDIFELKSKLVQEGKTVKELTAKRPAKMVVTLEVKAEAEYVMVEVPIPAGCSYGDKIRNYGWYGREVYREYFREKTAIFYRNLPVGTYTIEINLEPRFTGEYTVNPAKAEQMYFPVFYGRNAMKTVEIE